MAGVNIQVKGTTQGAITDIAGKYTIANVDGAATRKFDPESAIGFFAEGHRYCDFCRWMEFGNVVEDVYEMNKAPQLVHNSGYRID